MKNRTLFRIGLGGAVLAAVCCFTPALVLVLAAIGMSAVLGWVDYVLFPALAAFLVLAGFAFARLRQASQPDASTHSSDD